MTSFVLASDLVPGQPGWSRAQAQATALAEPVGRILGFIPRVRLASLVMHPGGEAGAHSLDPVLRDEAGLSPSSLFVLPASLDWNLWQREAFGQILAEFRREHSSIPVFHDDVDPCHPLLVEYFAEMAARSLAGAQLPPQRAGLLLVASGHGDSGSRAQSYRLMRLVWEQLSLGRGEVAFLRHPQDFLAAALERCSREPYHWVPVPQNQWPSEHFDYARTILENFARQHPDFACCPLGDPPGDHPVLAAWLTQRMTRLWQETRTREAARIRSPKSEGAGCAPQIWSGNQWDPAGSDLPQTGFVAKTRSHNALAHVLRGVLPESDTYIVKVTWHGYATGTYTDPAALDLLLGALPGRAVLVEGHTSSRNLGGADWDWETEARDHRAWIKQQEMEYLRRTGLAEVITRHRAEYVNVTEAYWDGACTAPDRSVPLRRPELAAFLPELLLTLRGAPFLSFARFKGPTRLGISNLFGLIPAPLRTAWHGANITDFASVCCDLAKLYGSLFPMYGLVEALHSAVRWNRKGLYRSRWGNYDLVLSSGVVTLSQGLAGADILASRLQGQDVTRSAFFDVVRHELEWPEAAVNQPLPPELQSLFC